MRLRSFLLAAPTLAATLAIAACGGSPQGAPDATNGAQDGPLNVVVGFYPLEFAAQQIGGDHVKVTNLTKPGVEPHDLELSPKDVAIASEADLAVYEKGLQPAVDGAVAELGGKAFDVSGAAKLDLPTAGEHDHDHGTEDKGAQDKGGDHTDGEHADHAEHQGDGHDHGAVDPHFWLDPQRYRTVVQAMADRFAQADPAHKAEYTANASALADKLTRLDENYATRLKTCSNTDLVTSHAAFGYLAERYGFTQVPISGISPDEEPDPAALARISQFVKSHKVRTIYAETLVSPATAQTVASETGAKVATLDPIEGITDTSAGKNYLDVMNSNLDTLVKGQSCR